MKKYHFIIILLFSFVLLGMTQPVHSETEARLEELSSQQARIEQMKTVISSLFALAKDSDKRETVESALNELLNKIESIQERIRSRVEEVKEKRTETEEEKIEGTEVSGVISSNTNWRLKDSPYIVKDDVLIKKGVDLIIEPGVVIKFKKGQGRTNMGGFAIINEGNIVAEGKPNNKIIFTSVEKTPQLGDWGTIMTVSGGSIKFSYVEIKYASGGIQSQNARSTVVKSSYFYNNGTGVFLNKGDAIISNNVFEKNYAGISFMHIPYSGPFDDGTFRYEGIAKTEINNNVIRNNIGQATNEYHSGIRIEMSSSIVYILKINNNDIYGNSQGFSIRETGGFNEKRNKLPEISRNNIYDNKSYNVYFSGESDITIDMSNNWWGTTDKNSISNSIYDHYDSWRPGKIKYQPIATSEIKNAGLR